MRKTDGFIMRKFGIEAMIVAESVGLIGFDRIVSLNSSAAYIWESLPDTDFSVATIADLLMSRYDVEKSAACADAEELADVWLRAGIIKE